KRRTPSLGPRRCSVALFTWRRRIPAPWTTRRWPPLLKRGLCRTEPAGIGCCRAGRTASRRPNAKSRLAGGAKDASGTDQSALPLQFTQYVVWNHREKQYRGPAAGLEFG